MENLATSLELSISLPATATAFTCNSPPLPSSFPSSGGENNSEGDEIRGRRIDLDINKVPTLTLIEEEEEEEERWSTSTVVPRKKLRFTEEQLILLEQSFTHNHSLNPKEKEKLAKELKLKVRQVEVWFQNRRARTRLKQKEIEREFLKNWLGLLTEQNRMLRNEVELLRSMKMTDMPPSALRLCPHCDRTYLCHL